MGTRAQLLEPTNQAITSSCGKDLTRGRHRNINHTLLAGPVVVRPTQIPPSPSIHYLRSSRSLPAASVGPTRDQTTTLENDCMGTLNSGAIGMQKTLQATILRVAGGGHSNCGQVLANLIALTHAPNSWRNQAVGWKKWQSFCDIDQINPLHADVPAILRYIGWLYAEGCISGSSLRGYVSTIFPVYKKL
jgi:hypothetical protein